MIPRLPAGARGRVVVWGLLGSSPFGGMTWQVTHHLEGLRRLGFDVWYVEDSDNDDVYDPDTWWRTDGCRKNAAFVERQLRAIGFGDRWVFREPLRDACHGALDRAGLRELHASADAVLNLCGATLPREEHAGLRRLVYLETDPVASQVRVAEGVPWEIAKLGAHRHHATYGENLGAADCPVPVGRYDWIATRPPVVVDWWSGAAPPGPDAALTTVANWDTAGHDVAWAGAVWRWRKDLEFLRFRGLAHAAAPFPVELAVAHIPDGDAAAMRAAGWRLTDARALSDPARYREHIRGSLGELSVVKEMLSRPRTGWFSDRSVCYLAAGRPVVLQATGFEKLVPTGEGLFAFTTEDEARAALEALRSDWARHARAAEAIARDHFAAERVLDRLMRAVGL